MNMPLSCVDHNLMSFVFSDTYNPCKSGEPIIKKRQILTESLRKFTKEKTITSVETLHILECG